MRSRGEGGSALVVALLMLCVAQALVLAVTTRAIAAAQAVRREEDRVLALNAAEAGLAEAVQELAKENATREVTGTLGITDYAVEAEEESVAPSLSVATFTASARCRRQTRRIRLRVVVQRDETLRIVSLTRLDWASLP